MAFGGRSLSKMSDQTFDFICTACSEGGDIVEAVKYCVECSAYCCQPCVDGHKKYPVLRNHNILDISEGQDESADDQKPRLLEIPIERCKKHAGKVLDMYCGLHDEVGCSTCFVKDHKSCDDSHIHSIPDAIGKLFKLSDCKKTQSRLKDVVVAMETVVTAKDSQLDELKKSKEEALGNVDTFQKMLETFARKAADSTRQEIEIVYSELENKIVENKDTAEDIKKDLETTDDKLSQAEGNRAQQFVLEKVAKSRIEEAEKEKIRQLQHSTDAKISFTPDQSLREYMKALQGIGQVQKHQAQNQDNQHHSDLYKIKEKRTISIHLSDDSSMWDSLFCCLTHHDQLLVTDNANKKLKLVDILTMTVVDSLTLDNCPYDVCCISESEAAVALKQCKIQFVSTKNKLKPTRQLQMSHACFGVTYKNNKLYITDNGTRARVYDMNGFQLQILDQDRPLINNNRHIALSTNGSKIFVAGWVDGLVCLEDSGRHISTIKDTGLEYVDDVCADGKGSVFVVGYRSDAVIQYSELGERIGVVVGENDGKPRWRSMCFSKKLNTLFVASNVVNMYKLE